MPSTTSSSSTTSTTSAATTASDPSGPRQGHTGVTAADGHANRATFRKDIEGLRALAILLVVPFHAGLTGILPGGFIGVDVFFVISGFVITAQLAREVDRTGRVSLPGFYARRAKRLLPAAGVVLVATTVAVWLLNPKILWENIARDVVASSVYVVNWELAARKVDYLAEDVPPSPLQHFWSLSVEEQYYIVWPLIVLLCAAVAVRLGWHRRAVLAGGLALLVLVPSLTWSIVHTAQDPAQAYFVTTTRMWEFAVGGLVALGAGLLSRTPRLVAVVLAWLGLAAVVGTALWSVSESSWPGATALVPVLGTGLVIAMGESAGAAGPVAVLRFGLFQFLGTISYAVYLWHWPMLIVYKEWHGSLPLSHGLVIGVLCVVPAYLSYRLVENPVRNAELMKRTVPALSIGLNCMAAGVIAGLLLFAAVPNQGSVAADTGDEALELTSPPRAEPVPTSVEGAITPDPLRAAEDVPDLYAQDCQQEVGKADPVTCSYGPEDAATTIAVVGDSKAAQWVPALQVLAEDHDWRVVTYTKSRCTFSTGTTIQDGKPYTDCHEWGQNVLEELTGDARVDYVITSGSKSTALTGTGAGGGDPTREGMVTSLRDAWDRLTAVGTKVMVLADTPQTGGDVYKCVSENADDLTRCAYDRAEGVAGSGAPVQLAAAEGDDAFDLSKGARPGTPLPDLYYLDLVDWICPGQECTPVDGNVLIYRQGSHLTKTYVETLAPLFEQALTRMGAPA